MIADDDERWLFPLFGIEWGATSLVAPAPAALTAWTGGAGAAPVCLPRGTDGWKLGPIRGRWSAGETGPTAAILTLVLPGTSQPPRVTPDHHIGLVLPLIREAGGLAIWRYGCTVESGVVVRDREREMKRKICCAATIMVLNTNYIQQ